MNPITYWQQILATPGDESLKAHYIQALEQAGDRRSEIFRLSAELQKYPVYYVQHEELARQYENSLEEWRADFAAPAGRWQAEVRFIRGWPIEITIAADDFIRYAAEIVVMMPLRHLNLTAIPEAPGVFNVMQMGQIASLNGSRQPWTNEAITALATSSQLQSLRWLDLSHIGITDTEVEILASSPRLKDLDHLDLQNNPCRDPVDASAGYGADGETGQIVYESIYLPEFGRELEARHGHIGWLHALEHFMAKHPPSRYLS